MPAVHAFGGEAANGRLLLKFRHEASAAEREHALKQVNGQIEESFGFDGREHVHKVVLGENLSVDKAVDSLSSDSAVSYAEQDSIVHAQVLSNDPGWTGGRMWGMAGDLSSPKNAYGS